MDECFVVGLSDKYPSEVNTNETTYENVEIVRLYENDFLPEGNQVIALAPAEERTAGLHPLEIDVQRSYQIKRQNQLSRLASNSVIQALPNVYKVNTEASLFPEQPAKTVSVVFNDPGLEEQHDTALAADASQIPLTVQYCGKNETETTQDSGTDEDEDPPPWPPSVPGKRSVMTDACYMCFKKFSQKKNMYAHIRKVHSSQPNIQGGIICPLCKTRSLRLEHLRKHLSALHHIEIINKERQFNTMQDFKAWKEYVEKETFSYFISKSATKLLALNQAKTYYKCHRSGVCSDKKKTAAKKWTSYKIGATCPASMEVTENAYGVNVTFWATHVGHNPLSTNERHQVEELRDQRQRSRDQIQDNDQEEPNIQPKSPLPEEPNQAKCSMGRIPKATRLRRCVEQSLLVEKAAHLLHVLDTTELSASYCPKISLMLDNLTSIVKRQAVGNVAEKRGNKKRQNKDLLNNSDRESKEDVKLPEKRNRRKKNVPIKPS